jgi:oxygen-independent coproporphyrinogen-3 oxidase
VLQVDGLEFEAYQRRFAADAFDDMAVLLDLEHLGLATISAGRLMLTTAGLERSDTIGPWLYSAGVRTLMEAYELR